MNERQNVNLTTGSDMSDNRAASIETGVALELRRLADDIADFASVHKSRLRRLVDVPQVEGGADEEFERRQLQLESRERELEQRERDALQHVEEECAQLTAAWDRLEAEQRRVLAHGENSAPVNAAPQPASAIAATLSNNNVGDVDLIGDFDMPAAGPPLNEPWSREPAAQQFQQMKREIRRHARRRKP